MVTVFAWICNHLLVERKEYKGKWLQNHLLNSGDYGGANLKVWLTSELVFVFSGKDWAVSLGWVKPGCSQDSGSEVEVSAILYRNLKKLNKGRQDLISDQEGEKTDHEMVRCDQCQLVNPTHSVNSMRNLGVQVIKKMVNITCYCNSMLISWFVAPGLPLSVTWLCCG